MATNRRKREQRKIQYGNSKQRAESHESASGVTSFKVPEGMKLFQVKKEGVYKFDIVPYIVGKGNPCEPEGNAWYERTFFTHRGIGPEQKSYCCLARTFKKRCPVCEDMLSMRRASDPDPELIKGLQPKERQMFLIIDRNDPESGIQLFEYSYHLFGKMLDEKIKASDDEDGYDRFFHLEGGMTLKVSFKEETMGKNKFYKCSNIEMRPRSEDLPEDLIEKAPCLDDLLIELKYDKYKAMYEMADGEEPEEDDDEPKKKVTRKASKPKVEEPEDEPEDDEDEPEDDDIPTADDAGIEVGCTVDCEHGVCTVSKISSDGTSLTLKDKKGKVHKAIGVADVELVEEEEEEEPEEEAPKKRGPGRPKKKPVEEEEPEDDEDEPEDDEEPEDEWEDEDEPEDDDDDEEPPPVKRGPGRPKKK
jgi:hypothetical protein